MDIVVDDLEKTGAKLQENLAAVEMVVKIRMCHLLKQIKVIT